MINQLTAWRKLAAIYLANDLNDFPPAYVLNLSKALRDACNRIDELEAEVAIYADCRKDWEVERRDLTLAKMALEARLKAVTVDKHIAALGAHRARQDQRSK